MVKPHRSPLAASDLFGLSVSIPEGFEYQPEFLTRDEELELVAHFKNLAFKPFEFQGYVGNRKILSFGWRYDFNTRDLHRAEDIPPFLTTVRKRAAEFAGTVPIGLQQVLLTEYAPRAGIGWHRDKAVFGEVVGISLLSACTLRFRRMKDTGWERASIIAEPGSAYLLRGPSRTEWEHSIPAVDSLRYSITFRNLRSDSC